jgi:disulfide bond formation protein DsbB
MPSARSRHLFVLACSLALLALGASVYLEKVVLLRPCSLCLVQRGCMALVAFVCALARFHRPGISGTRAYAASALVFVGLGAASATRQLWLQLQAPAAQHMCHPNLFLDGKSEPLLETVKVFALGSPDCAIINWTLLGMSLPEWSLLVFAGLGVIALMQLFER